MKARFHFVVFMLLGLICWTISMIGPQNAWSLELIIWGTVSLLLALGNLCFPRWFEGKTRIFIGVFWAVYGIRCMIHGFLFPLAGLFLAVFGAFLIIFPKFD